MSECVCVYIALASTRFNGFWVWLHFFLHVIITWLLININPFPSPFAHFNLNNNNQKKKCTHTQTHIESPKRYLAMTSSGHSLFFSRSSSNWPVRYIKGISIDFIATNQLENEMEIWTIIILRLNHFEQNFRVKWSSRSRFMSKCRNIYICMTVVMKLFEKKQKICKIIFLECTNKQSIDGA